MRALIVFAILVALANPTYAQESEVTRSSLFDTCTYLNGKSIGDERANEINCLVARVGANTIEAHVAKRESVIREFVWNQSGGPTLILEYVRKEDGRTQVSIYDPVVRGAGFAASIPDHIWEGLVSRMNSLRATGAVLHGDIAGRNVSAPDSQQEVICLDAWSAHVETALAGHPPASVDVDACDSDDYSFVDTLAEAAVDALPPCLQLDAMYFDIPALRLQYCSRLAGDKMVAADALNSSLLLNGTDTKDHKRSVSDFESVMSDSVELKMFGSPPSRSNRTAASKWTSAQITLPYLWLYPVVALGGGSRAEIRGTAWCSPNGTGYFYAPYRQLWNSGKDGRMVLTYMSIGEFVKDKEE